MDAKKTKVNLEVKGHGRKKIHHGKSYFSQNQANHKDQGKTRDYGQPDVPNVLDAGLQLCAVKLFFEKNLQDDVGHEKIDDRRREQILEER